MNYVRVLIVASLGIMSACKAGAGFNWSSSGGTTPSSSGSSPAAASSPSESSAGESSSEAPVAASGYDRDKADKERRELKTAAAAEAWYKRSAPMQIKAACGIDVSATIDVASFNTEEKPELYSIVGDGYCGQIPSIIEGVCSDATGKAAVRNVKAIHCERLIGKATKGTAKIVTGWQGTKHALDFVNGKLTLRMSGQESTSHYLGRSVIKQLWPVVPWQRDTNAFIGGLRKHFTDWVEDKDGVEFTVDIDPKGFATVNYMWSFYTCGGNGNSNDEGYARAYPNAGHLHKFLELLWESDKGKQILRKVKKITCSATPDPKGRAPELVGDRLVFYGRVLKDHHKASYVSGFDPHRIPEYDAYYAFALFRKAQNLGGECKWPRMAFENDPEGARLCPQ